MQVKDVRPEPFVKWISCDRCERHLGHKGGNRVWVQAFGRGSNPHKVWDSELIRHRSGGLHKLLADAAALPIRKEGSTVASAMESC